MEFECNPQKSQAFMAARWERFANLKGRIIQAIQEAVADSADKAHQRGWEPFDNAEITSGIACAVADDIRQAMCPNCSILSYQ